MKYEVRMNGWLKVEFEDLDNAYNFFNEMADLDEWNLVELIVNMEVMIWYDAA